MEICRLCLFKGDDTQVLSIWNNEIKNLAEKIKNCVAINVQEMDELPTSACLSCITQIENWIVFKETCQKSNNILLKTFSERKYQNNLFDSQAKSLYAECSDYFENISLDDDNCITKASSKAPCSRKKKSKLKTMKRRVRKKRYQLLMMDQSDRENDVDNFPDEEFYDVNLKSVFVVNPYVCEICSEEFKYCLDFLDHQETHNGQPVFNCDKCSEIFTSRKELVEHDRNHRSPCPQCGKLILKSSVKLHLVQHTDKYKCSQCSVRCNSKAALEQHVITVHTDIKNHICETCGKCFSSQTAMRVHMRSHSDERLYPCKLCNYAGRTASAIYIHMSTHANDLCVCEVCSKTFKSNRNLSDHLRRVHSKIKKHECTYCDKKFVDKYMLCVHIRCHTGVRPYQCKMCEKAFIRSDGLKEHMATHGKRVMYDCRQCGKKFTSKRGVTRHTCNSPL